jgi:Ca2+-binding EF-hand superfamily protein
VECRDSAVTAHFNKICCRCFPSGTGKVNFDGFCRIAAHFLEEEDSEAMQEELKEAFRLYDREGKSRINGELNYLRECWQHKYMWVLVLKYVVHTCTALVYTVKNS